MAKTRGGKKRAYKKVGRLSATKCYQQFCRSQYRAGLVPSASGRFASASNLSDKIRLVYEALVRQLG